MCSLMIKKCSVKYDRHHHTTTSLLWHNNDCWKWSENSGTKTGGKLWDGNKIQECRGESDSGTMMGMCLRSFLPTVSDSQLVTRDGWWRREDRGGEWGGSVHTVLYSVHGQYRPVSAVLFLSQLLQCWWWTQSWSLAPLHSPNTHLHIRDIHHHHHHHYHQC